MKQILSFFGFIVLCTTAFASTGVSQVNGLANSGLKQFSCTMDIQQIDPDTGKMGAAASQFSVVVASDETSAKAAALNKLKIYGPVDGSVFYLSDDSKQFRVNAISCN